MSLISDDETIYTETKRRKKNFINLSKKEKMKKIPIKVSKN